MRMKAADQLREFALAVKALANDETLSREQLGEKLCEGRPGFLKFSPKIT